MALTYTSGGGAAEVELINIKEIAGYRISALLFPGAGIPRDHFFVSVVECKPAQTKLTHLGGLPNGAQGVVGDLVLGSGSKQYKFPEIDLVSINTRITQEHRVRSLLFSYARNVVGLASADVPGQPEEEKEQGAAESNQVVNASPNGLLGDEYKFELSSADGPHEVENLLAFQSHQDPSATVVRFLSVANKSNSWLAEILRLHNDRVGPQGLIPASNIAFSQLGANNPMVVDANRIQSMSVDHCVGYMAGSAVSDLHHVARYVRDSAAFSATQQPDQGPPSYPDKFHAFPSYNTIALAQAVEIATIAFKQGYYSFDTLMPE